MASRSISGIWIVSTGPHDNRWLSASPCSKQGAKFNVVAFFWPALVTRRFSTQTREIWRHAAVWQLTGRIRAKGRVGDVKVERRLVPRPEVKNGADFVLMFLLVEVLAVVLVIVFG